MRMSASKPLFTPTRSFWRAATSSSVEMGPKAALDPSSSVERVRAPLPERETRTQPRHADVELRIERTIEAVEQQGRGLPAAVERGEPREIVGGEATLGVDPERELQKTSSFVELVELGEQAAEGLERGREVDLGDDRPQHDEGARHVAAVQTKHGERVACFDEVRRELDRALGSAARTFSCELASSPPMNHRRTLPAA
jgi:hypothetical protein